ncbi:MAG: PIG-L family deacetylase [bacterium]
MVVAPHCDDEVLGAGGLIMKSIERNARVKIVVVTNGDNNIFSTDIEFKTFHANPKKYVEAGEIRQRESIRAAGSLGVKAGDIAFLGYPDRGIKALYLTNWPNHNPYRSLATHTTRSPYKLTYEPGVIYSGENLLRNLERIIGEFSPTIVVSPHEDDHHKDHKYTFEFVKMALGELYPEGGEADAARPLLLAYLIHFRNFPRPKGFKPEEYIRPPFSASFDMSWFKLMMDVEDVDSKYDAIRLYSSQIKVPELGRLMRSFARRNELFEEVKY